MKILFIGMPDEFQSEVAKAIVNLEELAIFDNQILPTNVVVHIDAIIFCSEEDKYIEQAKECEELDIPYLFCLWGEHEDHGKFVIFCDNIAPIEMGKIFQDAASKNIDPMIKPSLITEVKKAQQLTIWDNIITDENVWAQAIHMLDQKLKKAQLQI